MARVGLQRYKKKNPVCVQRKMSVQSEYRLPSWENASSAFVSFSVNS